MPLLVLDFPAFDPVLFSIGPFAIRWYALAYIFGILLGWLYARMLIRNDTLWGGKAPLTTTDFDDYVIWVTFGIILGGRIGYVLSPHREAMAQIMKLQYYVTACSNDAMQRAVLVALDRAADYPAHMVQAFRTRRDRMVERLNGMPGVSCHCPEGAFYVFPKVHVDGCSAEEIALEILADGVLCSPGTAFGDAGAGHLRLAYTTSLPNIERGLDLIAGTLDRLRSGAGRRVG